MSDHSPCALEREGQVVDLLPFGVFLRDGTALFRLPSRSRHLSVVFQNPHRVIPLTETLPGIFEGTAQASEGDRYLISRSPDGDDPTPDALAFDQPELHSPSRIIDLRYPWRSPRVPEATAGRHAVYNLNVATFRPRRQAGSSSDPWTTGTFEEVIRHLSRIRQMGFTALMVQPIHDGLMPDWGYQNSFLFAATHSYGGPRGFQRLVDAAHAEGLAVYLDIVLNHLADEANYLHQHFGDDLHGDATPWGRGMNFTIAPGRPEGLVAEILLEAAVLPFWYFNVDGIRLDAAHCLAPHFLQELSARVHHVYPKAVIILEHPDRDEERRGLHQPCLVAEKYGATHQYRDSISLAWLGACGDLSRTYLLPYAEVTVTDLATLYNTLDEHSFLWLVPDNHDHSGNGPAGERKYDTIGHRRARAIMALNLVAPGIKGLFQGAEGFLGREQNHTWQYFRSPLCGFKDAVREGRLNELRNPETLDGHDPEPQGDPFSPETFQQSIPPFDALQSGAPARQVAHLTEMLLLLQEEPLLRRSSSKVRYEPLGDSCLSAWVWDPADTETQALLVLSAVKALDTVLDLSEQLLGIDELHNLDVRKFAVLIQTEDDCHVSPGEERYQMAFSSGSGAGAVIVRLGQL